MSSVLQSIRPEFIEQPENIEKNITSFNNILIMTRQNKTKVHIRNPIYPTTSGIYNRTPYNRVNYAGLSNIYELDFIAQIYSPEKLFYEIFKSKELLEYYPNQNLNGSIELDYNQYLQSKTIFYVNDYSVSYETVSQEFGDTIYYAQKPTISDDLQSTQSINVKVRGYAIEWHGFDANYFNDFNKLEDYGKYNLSLFNKKKYSGGSFGISGIFTNTTINNSYLKATASTGVFTSNVLVNATRNIERIKLTKIDVLNGGTINYQISADNGVHWDNITTYDEYITLSNYGTKLKIRITITGSAMVDSIRIDSDEFSINTNISNSNMKLEVGNNSDGWTQINSDELTLFSTTNLQYKITSIRPYTTLVLRLVKIAYV